jgi:pimeloyl-ACP methyl ester carboxylesterase
VSVTAGGAAGGAADVGLHTVEQPGEGGDGDGDGDGGGPTVVVVHGGMDRASSFGRVARHLRDLPMVRYDRRGYGRSIGLGTTDLAGHVDDLHAVIGGRDVVCFGHSVGGVIALGAAQAAPGQVRAVLAFEAPMPWAPWWPRPRQDRAEGHGDGAGPDHPDPADEAERFMRRMVGDRIWERLPARTRADRRAEGPALAADLAAVDLDAPPVDLAALVVPVLAAAGSATNWWHRRAAEELATGARAGELVIVDGATHGAHLTHPGAVAGLVRRARALATGEVGRR